MTDLVYLLVNTPLYKCAVHRTMELMRLRAGNRSGTEQQVPAGCAGPGCT